MLPNTMSSESDASIAGALSTLCVFSVIPSEILALTSIQVSSVTTGPVLRQVKTSSSQSQHVLTLRMCLTALVVYDYIITLKYEVDLLWRKKWSAAAWIFLLNRYLLLAYAISAVTPWGPQVSVMFCSQSRQGY